MFRADFFWNLNRLLWYPVLHCGFSPPFFFHQLFLLFAYEAVYCSSSVLLPQNEFCQQSGFKNWFGKTPCWKCPLPPEWLAGHLPASWSCDLFSCKAQVDKRIWSRKLQSKSIGRADRASLSGLKNAECLQWIKFFFNSTGKGSFAQEHLNY